MAFSLQPLELAPLVKQAQDSLRDFARGFGVGYEWEDQLGNAKAWVDPDRLIQVLVNLLSNAAKSSPTGESIRIRAFRMDQALRIEVEDRGPGIPEEFRPRLFEKFSQADASSTRQKGGSGLGLSIAKALIEGMGGTIGYQSAPGRTVFHLQLQEAP